MAKQAPSRGVTPSSSGKGQTPVQAQPPVKAQPPAAGGDRKQDPKKFRKLIDLGKERGYLTFTEVNEAVPREGSTPEELDSVMSMLGDMDIEVVESMDEEGFAPEVDAEAEAEPEPVEPEKPEPEERSFGDTSDPVRMYLQEMGGVPLLSREEE